MQDEFTDDELEELALSIEWTDANFAGGAPTMWRLKCCLIRATLAAAECQGLYPMPEGCRGDAMLVYPSAFGDPACLGKNYLTAFTSSVAHLNSFEPTNCDHVRTGLITVRVGLCTATPFSDMGSCNPGAWDGCDTENPARGSYAYEAMMVDGWTDAMIRAHQHMDCAGCEGVALESTAQVAEGTMVSVDAVWRLQW